MKWIEYFKTKWEIKSTLQLILIMIVFAITGSLSLLLAKPVLELASVNKEALADWLYYPIRILIIFPIYQLLILIVAWFFGQFNFFWKFEKKMLKRMGFKYFCK